MKNVATTIALYLAGIAASAPIVNFKEGSIDVSCLLMEWTVRILLTAYPQKLVPEEKFTDRENMIQHAPQQLETAQAEPSPDRSDLVYLGYGPDGWKREELKAFEQNRHEGIMDSEQLAKISKESFSNTPNRIYAIDNSNRLPVEQSIQKTSEFDTKLDMFTPLRQDRYDKMYGTTIQRNAKSSNDIDREGRLFRISDTKNREMGRFERELEHERQPRSPKDFSTDGADVLYLSYGPYGEYPPYGPWKEANIKYKLDGTRPGH